MIAANLINARLLSNQSPTQKVIVASLTLGLVGGYLFTAAHLYLDLAWIVAGVVMFTGLLGFIGANAISGALARAQGNSGLMSGINGVAQFGIGSVFSGLVSLSDSQDARVMCSVMALAAALSFISGLYLYLKPSEQITFDTALEQ